MYDLAIIGAGPAGMAAAATACAYGLNVALLEDVEFSGVLPLRLVTNPAPAAARGLVF